MDELKCYGKNIYVNDYEISVISRCGIELNSLSNMDELVWLLDKFLSDYDGDDYEDIDYVVSIIAERKYYMGKK